MSRFSQCLLKFSHRERDEVAGEEVRGEGDKKDRLVRDLKWEGFENV
jgi:hypothetical protein